LLKAGITGITTAITCNSAQRMPKMTHRVLCAGLVLAYVQPFAQAFAPAAFLGTTSSAFTAQGMRASNQNKHNHARNSARACGITQRVGLHMVAGGETTSLVANLLRFPQTWTFVLISGILALGWYDNDYDSA